MLTGSLQVKCNKYYAVINLKDPDGHRKIKWVNTGISAAGNNKRQANQALKTILSEYDNKIVDRYNPILFSDYIATWLDNMKFNIEPNTHQSYKYQIEKHIIPYFKKKKILLCDLSALDIKTFYNIKQKEGLSANYIKHLHANIRKSLQDALINGMVTFNVADRVQLPRVVKFQAGFYNVKQMNQLLQCAKGSDIESAIILACFYGLRRSEVLGLKWNAIDFDRKTIVISTTVTPMNAEMGVMAKKRTKNNSSFRTLPLIPEVEPYLRRLKEEQIHYQNLFKMEYIENDFVCKWQDGKPLRPDYITRKFKTLLIENGMEIIRFHDLRHSCASLLLSIGYDLKMIQEWLGHSNISTTGNMYAHLEYKTKICMGNSLGATIKIKNSNALENPLEK